MKALLMRIGVPLAQRAPGAGYLVAEGFAALLWVLRPRLRRRAARTLAPFVEGRRSLRRMVFRQFINVGRYYVDLALIPRRDPRGFERTTVVVETPERLGMVEREGAVIFLSAHYGNPDQLVQFLTSRRARFTAVVERLQPQTVHEIVQRLRGAHGGIFVEANLGGARRCLEALQRGEAVALLGDRDLTGTGVCVAMAGRRVSLPRGPWELAQRTGAPVVPVFLRRTARCRFSAWIGEAIVVPNNAEEGVAEAATCWARILEGQIRRDPGQWLVLQDFWTEHACGEG